MIRIKSHSCRVKIHSYRELSLCNFSSDLSLCEILESAVSMRIEAIKNWKSALLHISSELHVERRRVVRFEEKLDSRHTEKLTRRRRNQRRVLCLVLSKVRVSPGSTRDGPFIYVVRERATARPNDEGLSTYRRETKNTTRDSGHQWLLLILYIRLTIWLRSRWATVITIG